jgi:hypothetical protein
VIALALRLNTALKVSQDDEEIIETLRKEALESRTEALAMKKQVEVANNMINSLKLEINSLKKKLSDMQAIDYPTIGTHHRSSDSSQHHSSGMNSSNVSLSGHAPVSLGMLSDREVDEMFAREETSSYGDSINLNQFTPFQRWKMDNYIYTEDTPGGSVNHDLESVQRLEELVLRESMEQFKELPRFRKYTKTAATKSKKLEADSRPSTASYDYSCALTPVNKNMRSQQVSFILPEEEEKRSTRPNTASTGY